MTTDAAWARGYPVAEPYPASWHGFASPAALATVCALAGVAWEVGPDTPLEIAEIGCGTGYTAGVLAAGGPRWRVTGLDYNPAHVAEGRSLAAEAGLANLDLIEADLAELDGAELDRLPEFDLVIVHGLWSWVADPVREGVLRLLRRRLKPGGLAMLSYNALPGAATALGLARLVRGQIAAAGGRPEGLAAARTLVGRLAEAGARHLLPSTWRALLTGEQSAQRDGYLLHEFSTEHWRPSFFGDVAAALASARCDFVGSATLDENLPFMSLTQAQQALWAEAPDTAARQLLLDLCVPRAFRRDIWVRGLRRCAPDPATDRLVLTAAHLRRGELTLRTQAGEAALPAAAMDPVRDALARRPHSVAELRALPGCAGLTPAEMLVMLCGTGLALPLWQATPADPAADPAFAAARRFNAAAARRLAPHGIGAANLALATPSLGGGISAGPIELAVAQRLLADPRPMGEGRPDPAALTQAILPPGPPPPPEVRAELQDRVTAILADRLAAWRQLGIV